MGYSLDSTRRRVTAATIVVALGVALSLGVPALADDEHSTDGSQPVDRIADDGSIIPEAPHDAEGDGIYSHAELVEIEKDLDPEGSPYSYVCANEGAAEYRVVQSYPNTGEAKVNPNAGPVVDNADPCEGFDWVVGK